MLLPLLALLLLGAPPPEWVNQGSGSFQSPGGKVFRGVGVAMHQEGKPSEPLGWAAYFRAVSEIAKSLDSYVAQLTKAYQDPAAPPSTPGLQGFTQLTFGAVRVQTLVKDYEEQAAGASSSVQHVSSSLKLTLEKGDPGFSYKDYAESTTTPDPGSAEEDQQIVFAQSRGTEGVLEELRKGGIRLAGLWTDPDGAVYALAEMDLSKAAARTGSAEETERIRKAAQEAFDEVTPKK